MRHGERLSELDWLRVILILAVFLHHVFMPFNGDGWHVTNQQSSKVLDDIMVYFEQLRLQTLFFIAGAASLITLKKMSAVTFIKGKFQRLIVPLFIGMMLVVPPQNYYENIGNYGSILEAYKELIFSFETNHLWFIEFLVMFMLLSIPLKNLLNSHAGQQFVLSLERITQYRHGLFAIVLVVIVVRGLTKYIDPSDSHDLFNLSVSLFLLFFFIIGMCFVSSKKVWQALATHRQTNLKWFVVSSILFYSYYYSPDLSPYLSLTVRWQIWWLVCSLVSWTGLLVMIGYASRYCKQTPKWLHQANELIYPFYILHQTVIVTAAFYIVQWQASIAVKSLSLLVSSLVICCSICYWLVRSFNPIRILFGVKPRPAL